MHEGAGKRDKMLLVIGGLKFLKGILLLALSIGALKLIGRDLDSDLKRLIEQLNVDPQNHYFRLALSKVAGINAKNLSLFSIGTFFYSGLYFAEGIGLLLQKRWGEWLTVIVTSSFLPLEVYELMKRFNLLKLVVVVLNVAIVAYLIWRLKPDKPKKK
jgi:uncharacterized membrane protein (DUF2068 family)